MEQALTPLRVVHPLTILGLVDSTASSQMLTRLTSPLGTTLEVFTSLTQARARALQPPPPAVIVAEQPLRDTEALALLDAIDPDQRLVRVIYLTVQPASQVVVEAMRRGAYGVYESPLSDGALLGVLESALEDYQRRSSDQQFLTDHLRRLNRLSDAERDVLEAVYQGKLNKQIARELGVSVRTVEQRRRRLFEKMEVASAIPLASEVAAARTLLRVYANSTSGTCPDSPFRTSAFAAPEVAADGMPTY